MYRCREQVSGHCEVELIDEYTETCGCPLGASLLAKSIAPRAKTCRIFWHIYGMQTRGSVNNDSSAEMGSRVSVAGYSLVSSSIYIKTSPAAKPRFEFSTRKLKIRSTQKYISDHQVKNN